MFLYICGHILCSVYFETCSREKKLFSPCLNLNYGNTNQSVGEVEKVVETLACGLWTRSITRSSNFHLCSRNSLEVRIKCFLLPNVFFFPSVVPRRYFLQIR